MKTPMEWVEYFQDKDPPAESPEQVAEIFAECQRDAVDDVIAMVRVVEARHALSTALRLRRRWGACDAADDAIAVARRRVTRLEKIAKAKSG